MLVQFSFSNFKCFKEENVINLISSKGKNHQKYSVETPFRYSVLKTLSVYGANASGKSKLFDAFKFMKVVICPPKRNNKIPVFDYWQTKYDPFRLDTDSKDKTSFFETVFVLNNIQYRYGFELNAERIISEWLYRKEKREVEVLTRDEKLKTYVNYKYISAKIADSITSAKMISETVPFLSVLSTFSEPLCKSIVDWFESIAVISANNIRTIPQLTDSEKASAIVEFLKAFDLSKSSYSTVEATNLSFLTDTLSPLLEKIELEFERKLYKPSEKANIDVRFDTSRLLRADKQSLASYYNTLFNIGVVSCNDIRKEIDLPYIEGGDAHFVQVNLATL